LGETAVPDSLLALERHLQYPVVYIRRTASPDDFIAKSTSVHTSSHASFRELVIGSLEAAEGAVLSHGSYLLLRNAVQTEAARLRP